MKLIRPVNKLISNELVSIIPLSKPDPNTTYHYIIYVYDWKLKERKRKLEKLKNTFIERMNDQ